MRVNLSKILFDCELKLPATRRRGSSMQGKCLSFEIRSLIPLETGHTAHEKAAGMRSLSIFRPVILLELF
jgi:hypothetical protein